MYLFFINQFLLPLTIYLTTIHIQGVCAKWWLLSQYQWPNDEGIGVICDHIPGLERLQRQYCHRYPAVMQSIGDGVRLGINECQQQFRYNRWNCSTNARDMSLFGKHVLKTLSRETAFIYAITSAGVVHSISRWCSRGLLANCACDPRRTGDHHRRGRDISGEFSWGGCSQDLRFASVFARKFIDSQEINFRDANALMNLHNNRVGRKIVFKNARLVCKCHGVSGSCLVRTCWRITSEFRLVSAYLKHKYNNAKHVDLYQTTDNRIRAEKQKINWRSPKSDELIYLDTSPDYCNVNRKNGFYGTEGRICNKTSKGLDSCEIMCCGSGYQTQRVLFKYRCECKFYWCCQVKCQECKKIRDINTCRSERSASIGRKIT